MPPESNRVSRLESSFFYLLIAAAVLAPLVFWSSQYFALESAKTIVIGLLTLAAIVVLCISVIKKREIRLPPRSIVTIGTLMALSILVSSIGSGHFMKSFFGQGFELGSGSFLITLLLASLVAFVAVVRRADRVIILYAGLFGAFILVWILQILRVLVGADFVSLGILGNVTSSIVGNWFSFGIFSAVIAVIAFTAIYFLRLSSRMKVAYWVLFAISVISLLIVNSREVWQAMALVFLGYTIYLSSQKLRPQGGAISAFFRRIAWIPLIAFVISTLLAWYGLTLVGPLVGKLNAGYSELVMPWRMTMDVAAGEIKESPVLGAGPNRFTQAFLAYKPSAINTTDAWGVEFNSGFGLIPTFVVTQGLAGLVLWMLFFVFYGILAVKSLRGLVRPGGAGEAISVDERPYAHFVILSSFGAATLVWLTAIFYVPSHAIVYYGFILTGIWLGVSVAYGRLRPLDIVSRRGDRGYKIILAVQAIILVIAVLWGATYIKNTSALAYFGKGVRQLTVTADPIAADKSFATAVTLNPLDVYWQARVEAGISQTNRILSTITATSTASTSAATVLAATEIVKKAVEFSDKAIASDPDNYNNYVSRARVSELATAMKMQDAYESAVAAYMNAIRRNSGNPSIYLSLARLQASQDKLDDSIQAIGAALQVKPNYLDAVYLLSQVEAAKGNLPDAIIAADFATRLNPQNPLLFFQLGLLQYNSADYASASTSLAKALSLNPDYANASYFLGLSAARVGNISEAIAIFEKLLAANPGNEEIALILTTLRAGKPLFGAGPQSQAARPEQRSTPPIKQQ